MDGFLFVLIAAFALMYLLLIRPQRTQQRRHNELVERLKVGDEVITVGGLYGDVTDVHPDRVSLEIAEDVEVEVAKRAIASVLPPAVDEEPEEEADEILAAESEAETEAEVAVAEPASDADAAVAEPDSDAEALVVGEAEPREAGDGASREPVDSGAGEDGARQ